MANKGRPILDTLGIGLLDPEYSRGELLDGNPLVWMLEVDGLIVDARWLPEAVQVQTWQRGLIPYVPAHAGGDDPVTPSASAAPPRCLHDAGPGRAQAVRPLGVMTSCSPNGCSTDSPVEPLTGDPEQRFVLVTRATRSSD